MTVTVSIHVPRVEDDVAVRVGGSRVCRFNPRPPCGGRPAAQRR